MAILKKVNLGYIKQHPYMFGAILLVFGLLFYLLLNRGVDANGEPVGSTTVVNPGPSDAQIAAGLQLQMAQLGANASITAATIERDTQIALAQIAATANTAGYQSQENLAALALQGQLAEIQANYNLGKGQLEASVASLSMQLANNLAITNSNNQFMIDYAKNAQDAATQQLLIGANLQATLGAQQLDAYKYATLINVIPTLNSGKRDNAFAIVAGNLTGADAIAAMQPNGANNGGSSLNPLTLISPLAGMVG